MTCTALLSPQLWRRSPAALQRTGFLALCAMLALLAGCGAGSASDGGTSAISSGGGVHSAAPTGKTSSEGPTSSDTSTRTTAPAPGEASAASDMASGAAMEGGVEGGMPDPDVGVEPPDEPEPQTSAGTLTAGVWDDAANPDVFDSFVADVREAAPQVLAVDFARRVLVQVRDASEAPLGGARLQVLAGDEVVVDAPAGSDGRFLFLPFYDAPDHRGPFTVRALYGDDVAESNLDPAETSELDLVMQQATASTEQRPLDLAFVVDATGSMGDELEWLKTEVDAIVGEISETFPNASLRFSVIVYRDEGDDYISRSFDFTDSLSTFRSNLGKQSAGGGGDYPEAMDAGMVDTTELSWRDGDVARVAFLIADAPPHDDRIGASLDQANVLRMLGVRVHTIAASGVGTLAEYVMRTASYLSLANYVFLTDDSGVGNSHAEPHIPCYHVEKLYDAVLRLIVGELEGRDIYVDAQDAIRTVGQPDGATCQRPVADETADPEPVAEQE